MARWDDLQAKVTAAYARLDLPAWPDPHPGGAEASDEEYSRLTNPERYAIVHARARVWATVLADDLGARAEPLDLAQLHSGHFRSDEYGGGVRLTSPRPGTLPLLLLDRNGPLAVLQIAVAGSPSAIGEPTAQATGDAPPEPGAGRPPRMPEIYAAQPAALPRPGTAHPGVTTETGTASPVFTSGNEPARTDRQPPAQAPVVLETWPDCGCDACDRGSDDLLEAIDETIARVVGGPLVVLWGSGWHGQWYPDGGSAANADLDWVMDVGRRLAAGADARLPTGTTALVGKPWI